ncbi:MAG: lysophospholipid acyltransferase family protein [Bacteroidia bacterium]|nr:lysophospholipid acyltransferase family protein [Bacteroidia bacterium]
MYYIVYGLLWLVSLLPLRILYGIGDCFYGLTYYILKYRRDIVINNLLIAFPHKTEKERIAIAKKFYRNLIDMFIETIKMISVSDKFLAKRIKGNWEVVKNIYPTGRSVQVHLGHNFNWEWGNAVFVNETPFKLLAVYMPIANKIFERLFYKLRTRNGAIFLRATNMKEEFLTHQDTQYLLGLIADQNPGNPANAWWIHFFGRPTPFLKGPAKAAIANNTAVVFAFIHKPRRGYYEAVFTLVVENPASLTQEELTKKFVLYLEDVIKHYPESWLWSHRRWKWEWKPEYGEIIS